MNKEFDYERILQEELYILCKHINISFSDAENMATYKRREQINILKEDFERQKRQIESDKAKRK